VARKRIPDCSIARSLDEVGEWWTLLIIREALFGKRHFAEFQRTLGIARNILTARLRALVRHGIFRRAPDGGRRRAYELTDKGRDLLTVVLALRQWGERWVCPGGLATELVDALDNTRVARLEPRSESGRRLTLADIRIVPRAHQRRA